MDGLKEILKQVQDVKDNYNPGLAVMCVLPTMYRRTRYGAKAIDALIDSELPTFFRERGGLLRINACAAVQEAVSEHMPLCDYSPKSKATEQYLELSRNVISKVEG